MKQDTIRIRKLQAIKEYHRCEAIQKKVWQFEDREIIPINELITIQRSGGAILGAFDRPNLPRRLPAGQAGQAGRMIGFVFGFAGIHNGQLIHCSRMLAVLPKYRDSDVGYRLKLAQRQFALKQGIRLITWTFDPLQSLNAYFNIRKLGIIIRTYYINLYGRSSSILNRDFATDRFLAEWWITSPRVKKILGQRGKTGKQSIPSFQNQIINPTKIRPASPSGGRDGWLRCGKPRLNLRAPELLVEIPSDIISLKLAQPNLARHWREQTRRIFTRYLKSYTITNFISHLVSGQRRSFYILTRNRS